MKRMNWTSKSLFLLHPQFIHFSYTSAFPLTVQKPHKSIILHQMSGTNQCINRLLVAGSWIAGVRYLAQEMVSEILLLNHPICPRLWKSSPRMIWLASDPAAAAVLKEMQGRFLAMAKGVWHNCDNPSTCNAADPDDYCMHTKTVCGSVYCPIFD